MPNAHRNVIEANASYESLSPIDDAERRRREEAVEYAKASLAMEGFHLDDEAEAIYARYVAGEIELAMVGELLRG